MSDRKSGAPRKIVWCPSPFHAKDAPVECARTNQRRIAATCQAPACDTWARYIRPREAERDA